jgi:hypothetical protein
MMMKRLASACALVSLVLAGAPGAGWAQEGASEDHGTSSAGFHVGGLRNWIFRSFIVDGGDDATTLGIELESYLGVAGYEVKNIAYLEVADFPRAIPGQPPGNPVAGSIEAATGISDLLTGFWFSKQGPHHGKHHFAPGLAAQFPTASSETLGSGTWSIGPSIDYEYESGRLFAGAIALQIWSFAGDPDREAVSMLMIKPFIYYSLSEQWDLIYVPYGVSVYWLKPSGEKVYFPIGGGAQRLFRLGTVDMNLGLQLFYNVVRPTKGTVWDLRFVIDLAF